MQDLRHDLEQLQEYVFPGKEKLPRYNLQQQLSWENRPGETDQVR